MVTAHLDGALGARLTDRIIMTPSGIHMDMILSLVLPGITHVGTIPMHGTMDGGTVGTTDGGTIGVTHMLTLGTMAGTTDGVSTTLGRRTPTSTMAHVLP